MQNLSGTCFKTIVGIMLNDVVKYKKLMCSFMSLTGLAYNTVIECSEKKNLHDNGEIGQCKGSFLFVKKKTFLMVWENFHIVV